MLMLIKSVHKNNSATHFYGSHVVIVVADQSFGDSLKCCYYPI